MSERFSFRNEDGHRRSIDRRRVEATMHIGWQHIEALRERLGTTRSAARLAVTLYAGAHTGMKRKEVFAASALDAAAVTSGYVRLCEITDFVVTDGLHYRLTEAGRLTVREILAQINGAQS